MKICHNCHTSNPNDAKFCKRCGNPIKKKSNFVWFVGICVIIVAVVFIIASNSDNNEIKPMSYNNGTNNNYSAIPIKVVEVSKEKPSNSLSRGMWKITLNKVIESGKRKGQLKGGRQDGLGIVRYSSGDCYIGEFRDGQRHGMGIYLISDKDSYFTDCEDCKFYLGNWVSGEKNGNGTCYSKWGEILYSGNFNNNKPTGKYPVIEEREYKFEIINYNGESYIGETYKGQKDGFGIYIWTNENIWIGHWLNDVRKGEGILINKIGDYDYGVWDNNSANITDSSRLMKKLQDLQNF